MKKYRAWHKKLKEYFKVEIIDYSTKQIGIIGDNYGHKGFILFDFKDVVLEQQLEDGYYEGDILFDDHLEEHIYIVWNNEDHKFELIGDTYTLFIEILSDYEVVGNINQNIELLYWMDQ